ncbi:hypothetical protein SCOR_18165 [Sulfidibacter corallicola]|uniref:Uncharacterized protein n=1 Tax=Sulfidibacter corallicola TaxID=2818388 RepID=A0A8A4TVT8_SULCO|nr:hypothetical protein [Sulfidibacter corallicola]QTD53620.1 hypothetical protein J3U87_14295 [Sulfidibacter corallicola]
MKTRSCIRFLILAGLAACVAACSGPNPFDEVRAARRQYKTTLDFSVSKETDEITYEVNVQNLSGGTKLQELTVVVEAFDEGKNVFWKKKRELDVTGLGNYATKTLQFKDTAEGASEKLAYFNVRLAPDDESSDYKSYKEFMRVAQ